MVNGKHHVKVWDAYVIETDQPMIADRICWQFNNAVNGRRLSYEECLNHAITMVRKYGQEITTTAKDWGVKGWELASRIKVLELRELAERNRVDTSKLPDSTVLVCNPLLQLGEEAAVKMIRIAVDNGINVDEVKAQVTAVGRKKTLEDKIAAIDEFGQSDRVKEIKAQTKAGKVKVRPGRTPADKFHDALNTIGVLMDGFDLDAFKGAVKTWRPVALAVCNHLIRLYGLGAQLEE